MTTSSSEHNPVMEFAEKIQDLKGRIDSLQDDVRLASVREDIATIDTDTSGLDQRIKNLRASGYAFEKRLEGIATEMPQRWAGLKNQALQQTDQQARMLDLDLRNIESIMSSLVSRASNPILAMPIYNQADTAIFSLEEKVTAAKTTLEGMYEQYDSELGEVTGHLDQVEWTFQRLSEACFQLKASESAIMAVEAEWNKDSDKNGPKGIFFLTDQRMIFERKEEVATKKVLFVTTERKLVQELGFETPVVLTQSVTPTKQGIFKNEDHIEMLFASGAPYQRVHLHLNGQDCQVWAGLINRVKAGEFDKDRAVEISKEEIERVKNAPTVCPSCGGAINQPVLQGMDSIKCEFCGFVIRI